jgi:hypothetical protein
MTQRHSSQPFQEAIVEVVEAIRKWYFTICHDLCLEPPRVEIRKPAHVATYNMPAGGCYDPKTKTVTIFVHEGGGKRPEYVLAHELRHAFQHQNDIAPNERDCEKYELDFADRFKNGPEAGRYEGPIEGLSVFIKCNRCGCRMDAMHGRTCSQCHLEEVVERATERAPLPNRCACCGRLCEGGLCWECLRGPAPDEGARPSAPFDSARETGPSDRKPATKPSLLERLTAASRDRRKARAARKTAQNEEYWLRELDNHPSNGQQGWWAVEETYYVSAASAGEAIIRVGDQLMSHCPSVRFVGEELPADIERRLPR